jgi:hypothetical protein
MRTRETGRDSAVPLDAGSLATVTEPVCVRLAEPSL